MRAHRQCELHLLGGPQSHQLRKSFACGNVSGANWKCVQSQDDTTRWPEDGFKPRKTDEELNSVYPKFKIHSKVII